MALNRRERILAIVTGVLASVMVGYFLITALSGPLAGRRTARDMLREEVDAKTKQVELVRAAAARLADLRNRALPSDPKGAKEVYQNWLFELATAEKLRRAKVTAHAGRQGDVFNQLSFTVSGQGNLEQLTRFLYRFYSAGHLHRVRNLIIKPLNDTADLDLSISIEALSLPGADREDELSQVESSQLAMAEFSDYELISRRNLFAAYQPPPPPVVEEEAPEEEEEPEAPPPAFDPGRFTFLTGIVEVDGRPQVWLKARTTGEEFKLSEGDEFALGPVQGTVLEINHKDAEIEIGGERRLVALGKSLQRTETPPAAASSPGTSSPTVPASQPTEPASKPSSESDDSSEGSGWWF